MAAPISTPIDGFNVLLEQGSIVFLLHVRHPNLEDGLLLGRQALLHICLQPPQQEGPQHLHPCGQVSALQADCMHCQRVVFTDGENAQASIELLLSQSTNRT